MAGKKVLKWIDEKSVLRLNGEVYEAGGVLPADVLSKKRVKLFKELNLIASVANFTEEVEDDKSPEE